MKEALILGRLESILCNNFTFINKTISGLHLLPLTGREIGLTSIELYQFLLCVENEFDAFFSETDISRCSFFTLQDFCDSIMMKSRFH